MTPEIQIQATSDVTEEERVPGQPLQFTVKAETTLTAYLKEDNWEEGGKISIGFTPYINVSPDQFPHDVNEDLIRVKAREVALKMASELTDLPVDNLTAVHLHEGVGAITIVEKTEELTVQDE